MASIDAGHDPTGHKVVSERATDEHPAAARA